MKWLLALLILTSQALACGPSDNSCGFYSCLEEQYRCGDHRYLKATAAPLCERFLRAETRTKSARLLQWMPQVRVCLQNALKDTEFQSCGELRQKAVESHLDCYLATGYCELSLREKAKLLKIVGGKLWQRSFLKLGLSLEWHCRHNSASIVSEQGPSEHSTNELR